jgi:tRNA(Ser,Leu) C12 N-acetylase TAN1
MSEEARMQVIEYRVQTLETLVGENITQINSKLDTIIDSQADSQTAVATETAKRQALQYQVKEIKDDVGENTKDISNMRVSLAEKVGPGAIAGAVSAILVVLLKALVGI